MYLKFEPRTVLETPETLSFFQTSEGLLFVTRTLLSLSLMFNQTFAYKIITISIRNNSILAPKTFKKPLNNSKELLEELL